MTTSPAESDEARWTMVRVFPALWARRRLLALCAVGCAAVTLVLNLFLPPAFRSTARLLPDTDRERLSMLAQAAEVAQIIGVGAQRPDPARLYPAILGSETILRAAARHRYAAAEDSSSLPELFGCTRGTPEENLHAAVERLRERLDIHYENRTGVVTVSIVMHSPDLAAAVLRRIIEGLEHFMRHRRSTQASEQRLWIETRARDVGAELRAAEDALRSFREKNRKVFDSPRLLLEEERLARDVQVKSAVFIELARQLEIAKIEEIRTITIVNVLDPPLTPVEREGPRRTLNTVLAFCAALLAGSFAIAVYELYGDRLPRRGGA